MIGDFAESDGPAEFASPACFMHEVDPSYWGLGATSPELQRSAILRWRKSERQRLIVQRLGISSRDGIRCAGDIAAQLTDALACRTSLKLANQSALFAAVSVENPDPGIGRIRFEHGGLPFAFLGRRCGGAQCPLIFGAGAQCCRWREVWNILVPADGPELAPDVVIAPLVGYDRQGYRPQGMGEATSSDRDAAWPFLKKPRAIGVGYSQAAITTIYPLAHDIPMDVIVTEEESSE